MSAMSTAGRPQKAPRRVGSYPAAIEWIARNDDNDWLDADGVDTAYCESVTLTLVADVFGRTLEEATADLKAALAKIED